MKTSVSAYHFLRSRHPFITHTVLCLLLPFSVGTFLFHKLYRAYFLFFCRHFFCFTSFIVPTFSFSVGTFLFYKPNRACHPLLLFQNKKEREMKIPFSALVVLCFPGQSFHDLGKAHSVGCLNQYGIVRFQQIREAIHQFVPVGKIPHILRTVVSFQRRIIHSF